MSKVVQALSLLVVSSVGTCGPLAFIHGVSRSAAARMDLDVSRLHSPKSASGSGGSRGHDDSHGRSQSPSGSSLSVPDVVLEAGANPRAARAKSPKKTKRNVDASDFVCMVLSHGNAFAGGVMLATGIVHILVDALALALDAEPSFGSRENALLVPMMFCLLGILIPFALEKSGLVFWLVKHNKCFRSHKVLLHGNDGDDDGIGLGLGLGIGLGIGLVAAGSGGGSGAGFAKSGSTVDEQAPLRQGSSEDAKGDYSSMSRALPDGCTENNAQCRSKCVVPSVASTRLQGRLDFHKAMGSARTTAFAPLVFDAENRVDMLVDAHNNNNAHAHSHDHSHGQSHGHSHDHAHLDDSRHGDTSEHNHSDKGHTGDKGAPGLDLGLGVDTTDTTVSAGRGRGQTGHREQHQHVHQHAEKHSHMNYATFLMFLVLSIHSVTVGFTLGVSGQRPSQRNAFLALLVHKLFESSALGVSAAQNELTTVVSAELLVYNLAAPFGLMAGRSVAQHDGIGAEPEVALLGVAAGSFVYIALVEILGEEFENEEYRVLKFLFFAGGAAIMTALAWSA